MEAVLLIGIPGSRKSTFYREMFFATHLRINLDMLKTRRRETLLIEACLKAHQSFVVDNTNVTRAERARYISVAREVGFTVIGYYFPPELKSALERNRQRDGKAFVPSKGVVARYRQLERPSLDEGFGQLYFVRIDPATGRFIVDSWSD